MELDRKAPSSGSPKRFKVELSVTGMVGSLIVLLLGVVWVFIFGVLVGRGYQPTIPTPEMATVDKGVEKAEADPSKDVIAPEDLDFYQRLKQDGTAAKDQGPAEVPEVAEAAKSEKQVAAEPVKAKQEAAPAKEPVQMAAVASPAPGQLAVAPGSQAVQEAAEAKPEQAVSTGAQRFDYVYQAASVSEPQAALRLRDQIRGLGYGSEVKVVRGEDKVWHRVVVEFQASPEDLETVKAKLKTIGVPDPLLRSKRPVNNG